jgi:hypothetical protein
MTVHVPRKAVDVVGQAGKPRTISEFQTHQTTTRMGTTERAELGTEQYLPFAAVLEGFVILAKNEGFPWIWTRVKIGLNSKMPSCFPPGEFSPLKIPLFLC